MRIQTVCTAIIIPILMMATESFADKAVIIDGTWVIIGDGNLTQVDSRNVRKEPEERSYGMSMADIEKKFKIRQKMIRKAAERVNKLKEVLSQGVVPSSITDKLSTAEANITALQDNQLEIKGSIERKCESLDRLFDPDQHCCVTDFALVCISDAVATTYFPSDHAAGDCETCVQAIWDLFPHISSSRK